MLYSAKKTLDNVAYFPKNLPYTISGPHIKWRFFFSLPYLKYDEMVSTLIVFIPRGEKQLVQKMKGVGDVA
jgi:hypothetical protein